MTFDPSQLSQIGSYPRRIVCLTDETTETIYLLGEQDRIVGVSGYSTRPAESRLKPKVSAFTSAKFEKIAGLQPDLVLTFSDLQAEIARELIGRGVPVVAFNQRSVVEILEMMLLLGRVLGCDEKARVLVESITGDLNRISASTARFPFRPKVFFEEWKDPLISGIRWVEELIEIAGGETAFPELKDSALAKDRIVSADEVIARNPDVILASWCGMKVKKDEIRSRQGWHSISAVKNGHVYEVKSAHILQPGPGAVTEGVRQIHFALASVCGVEIPPELRPLERTDPEIRETSGRVGTISAS